MKRLLHEPLLHFLLLGAALFVAFGLMSRGGEEPAKIVVTPGQIESMAAGFTKVWQRAPTAAELEGLIQDYIREEVACREAAALGLDRNDSVIRRRLRMKVEFITDDLVSQVEPTNEELQAYLNRHPKAFRVEPRFTFKQVYLAPERHGEHLARDAQRLLDGLTQAGAAADLTGLGDPLLLGQEFADVSASEVARTFGDRFAAQLGDLAPGRWQGPVVSGYGVPPVMLSRFTPGRVPPLEEVRDAVLREWTNARRTEAREQFYQSLLQRYTVVVDRPTAAGDKTNTAAEPGKGGRTGG